MDSPDWPQSPGLVERRIRRSVFRGGSGPSGDDRGDAAARLQLFAAAPLAAAIRDRLAGGGFTPPRQSRQRGNVLRAKLGANRNAGPRARLLAAIRRPAGGGWRRQASGQTLERVYGKPLDAIASDVHASIGERPRNPLPAPAAPVVEAAIEARPLTAFAMQLVLADLMVTSRQLGRAETLFRQLRARPRNGRRRLPGWAWLRWRAETRRPRAAGGSAP